MLEREGFWRGVAIVVIVALLVSVLTSRLSPPLSLALLGVFGAATSIHGWFGILPRRRRPRAWPERLSPTRDGWSWIMPMHRQRWYHVLETVMGLVVLVVSVVGSVKLLV